MFNDPPFAVANSNILPQIIIQKYVLRHRSEVSTFNIILSSLNILPNCTLLSATIRSYVLNVCYEKNDIKTGHFFLKYGISILLSIK